MSDIPGPEERAALTPGQIPLSREDCALLTLLALTARVKDVERRLGPDLLDLMPEARALIQAAEAAFEKLYTHRS